MRPNIYREFYEKFLTDDTASTRSSVSASFIREYEVTKESLLEKLDEGVKVSFSHTVARINPSDRKSAFADFAYFTISGGSWNSMHPKGIELIRLYQEEPDHLVGVIHCLDGYSYRYRFDMEMTEKMFAHQFKLMYLAAFANRLEVQ